jgi:hypothetical protein
LVGWKSREDDAMLKSEAELMVRRSLEDNEAKLTDEQIKALAEVIMKIAGRMIEEALASWRPGVPGSRPTFFTD